MRVKYFVGKDRELERAAKKKKAARVYGPQPCRNCGDDYNSAGVCVKCRAALEVYRSVDDQNFRRFQEMQALVQRSGRITRG